MVKADDDTISLLREIRDTQRESLKHQKEHLDIARQQMARAEAQIAESLRLQKQAMARAKAAARIVFPLIVLCLVLILYLIVRYL